jgi:CRP-like cAMP-binding protein
MELKPIDVTSDRIKALMSKMPILVRLQEEGFDLPLLFSTNGLIRATTYEKGETIIKEGQFDSWIYWLLGGCVRITKKAKKICAFNQCGTVFGEMSVVSGKPRSASVIANDPVTCLSIDFSFMDRLDPNQRLLVRSIFLEEITIILSERLENTTNAHVANVQQHVSQVGIQCILEDCYSGEKVGNPVD